MTDLLQGVRVIEFCHVAAGPFCGMLFADMGADVIKVESPDGDSMRQWPPLRNGFSENFASVNRNKRSVVLDLKSEAGKSAARALIRSADIVIENNRPGVMDRLGLGYASFKKERPDLIYCSISAFGQSGPRVNEGGFDLTIQALSGIMSVTGEPESAPVKCGVPVSDFSSGLYAAFAVMSLLYAVRQGRAQGQHIDIAMLGASLGIAALQTSEYFGSIRASRPRRCVHRTRRHCASCWRRSSPIVRWPLSSMPSQPSACPAARSIPMRMRSLIRRSSTWAGCATSICRAASASRALVRRS
jgi:crotonobetainyl-CoA:carnitine CoA-transferase CaiB-like acyl-CoA transferase